ncbi:growth hormone-regulated TBC protein 1 [Rhipicephalus sanguineus]|uniref:growth hormone-regulated TBC protein 1 n=1 Tax=Rhipicephalus sanguineus TaxID=34632 RepID=UPI0020C4F2C5|nr:growth hormone-regulated TBC protein 1 [Rhipicephalus sanguineus]
MAVVTDADGSSMSAENEQRARVGPYGFEWPEGFDHEVHETFWRGYRAVLARRLHKWDRLLSNARPAAYPNLRHGSAKLKRYVRKGVPREHRKQVWMVLSGAAAMQIEQRGLYQSLLQQSRRPDLVETIQIDVPRTFPDNVYFQGGGQQQKSLFNILVAYAHFNQGVGYCQGLNFIAGLLLLATEDEEATFWLLRALLERLLPDYYGRHMTGLLTDIEVLAELVRQRMPQVHAHLAKHEVSWAIMTTKWFVCLFAEVLPIETVLRIWDSLFLEGSKVLFRVAITLVAQGQEKILAARGLGEIMAAFKEAASGPQVTDCHAFLKAIFKQPKSLKRAHIEQLRASCRERVIAARR